MERSASTTPTGETVSPVVTSPDPLDGGFHKSDGGDGLSPFSSQYSSCGESEFDRYCSANSVMGTPSLCSSMGVYHDFGDSDFGSLKSLDGFSLSGERFPRIFDEKQPHSPLSGDVGGLSHVGVFDRGSSSLGHGSGGGIDGGVSLLGSKSEVQGVKGFDGESGKKEDLAFMLKNVENVLLQGAVAARSAAETLFDCNHADEMEDERCREEDEDEVSSRYEHSEGEDSMFGYGSDGGSQPNSYYVRNVDYGRDEARKGENLVLMNQYVAFGSKDWDDFELDGMENTGGVSQIPDNFWEKRQLSGEKETDSQDFSPVMVISSGSPQWHEQEKNERVSVAGDHLQEVDKSIQYPQGSTADIHSLSCLEAQDTSGVCKEVQSNDGSDGYLESCSVYNVFEKQRRPSRVTTDLGFVEGDKEREDQDTTSDKASDKEREDQDTTSDKASDKEREDQDTTSDKASDHDDHLVAQQNLDPLPDNEGGEVSFPSIDIQREIRSDVLECKRLESSEGSASKSVSSWFDSDKGRIHEGSKFNKDEITTGKDKDLEMNAFYDELVHEMEEILLDSCDSSLGRLKQRNAVFHSEQFSPIRDGGSTASTSGQDDKHPLTRHSLEIDEIEVVGAKQKQGDISLSERLVGVKGYTVYVIRIRSGNDQWEVERRYRDFYSLYHQLKAFFATQGWILPPPWSSVEQESRKFFGNGSPNVIAERSALIQECLCSVVQSRYYSSPPSALIWFLSPPETLLCALQSNTMVPQSTAEADERVSSFGKTISLIVEIRPQKSVKELLDTQHYTCAGCHKHFDNGKTRVREIVRTFGWGKPRLCEYTGQLFCSSCHTNDTAVLPARVLHDWDFTPYAVSQLAKSYLDSIVDQPMLCVSAANPFLFSRVPTLLHIVGVRRKIGAMLPHIRCSFRRSIYRRLGYRKYLLETKDFFALRDLIDLSKGVFAALPAILEAVLKKIQEHITELCLECCDNGVPCGARQACENPSSLIFPFQEEEEIERCKTCKSVFHKHCFKKLAECHCGAVFKVVDVKHSMAKLRLGDASGTDGSVALLPMKSVSRPPVGFLSRMFSLSKQEKAKGHKDSDNVILMGSLPSTSL